MSKKMRQPQVGPNGEQFYLPHSDPHTRARLCLLCDDVAEWTRIGANEQRHYCSEHAEQQLDFKAESTTFSWAHEPEMLDGNGLSEDEWAHISESEALVARRIASGGINQPWVAKAPSDPHCIEEFAPGYG